jgi:hypothetical protein
MNSRARSLDLYEDGRTLLLGRAVREPLSPENRKWSFESALLCSGFIEAGVLVVFQIPSASERETEHAWANPNTRFPPTNLGSMWT